MIEDLRDSLDRLAGRVTVLEHHSWRAKLVLVGLGAVLFYVLYGFVQ